jgi:hypothetical protein
MAAVILGKLFEPGAPVRVLINGVWQDGKVRRRVGSKLRIEVNGLMFWREIRQVAGVWPGGDAQRN